MSEEEIKSLLALEKMAAASEAELADVREELEQSLQLSRARAEYGESAARQIAAGEVREAALREALAGFVLPSIRVAYDIAKKHDAEYADLAERKLFFAINEIERVLLERFVSENETTTTPPNPPCPLTCLSPGCGNAALDTGERCADCEARIVEGRSDEAGSYSLRDVEGAR